MTSTAYIARPQDIAVAAPFGITEDNATTQQIRAFASLGRDSGGFPTRVEILAGEIVCLFDGNYTIRIQADGFMVD